MKLHQNNQYKKYLKYLAAHAIQEFAILTN